jgi:phosphohistidine phosphatase
VTAFVTISSHIMNLILWRHADAEEGRDDLARRLTSKGRKQAERVAEWLDERLAKHARLLVSPAVRAQETAARLERPGKTCEAIAPGARAAAYLEAAGWPEGEGTVVLVGHQPAIGSAVALALTGKAVSWHMRKGAICWIASVEGESMPQVVAVLSPDLL